MADLLFWRTWGSNKPHLGVKARMGDKEILISVAPEIAYFESDENTSTARRVTPDDLAEFKKKPAVDSPWGKGKSKHNVQRQRLHAEVKKLYEELRALKSNQNPDYIVVPKLTWDAFAAEMMPNHGFDPEAWSAGFRHLHGKLTKKMVEPKELKSKIIASLSVDPTRRVWRKINYFGDHVWATFNNDVIHINTVFANFIDPQDDGVAND